MLLFPCPLGDPLKVKLAVLQPLHHLVLVIPGPILPSLPLEIHSEIRIHHRARQFLCRESSEPFLHEFVDDMLVGP